MITAGVDAGSVRTKAVLLDAASGRIIGADRAPTRHDPQQVARRVLDRALSAADITRGRVKMIVGTGYGRIALPFADDQITEITCHARGAHFHDPTVRTVIDIGGQDSKVIVLDDAGNPRDFAMNDRCAAGTGRFIEVMAAALDIGLEQFGSLALRAEAPAMITSTCTVFAESEVVGLIAEGARRENIAAGLCAAVAHRIAALAAPLHPRAPALVTGGVAINDGVFTALQRLMSIQLKRPDDPILTGAIGAAVVAAEKVKAGG